MAASGDCYRANGRFVVSRMSNGNDINFPKALYYGLLKAPVKGTRIYEYTGEQVAKLMFQYKHWGPWDSKPPR